MPTFSLKKINPRQIIIHLLAFYFLQQAFIEFAFMMNADFLQNLETGNEETTAIHRLAFLTNVGVFASLGDLAGLVIAIVISRKRKWHWLNVVLTLLAFFVLTNLIASSGSLTYVISGMRSYIGNLFLFFAIAGLLLLAISLTLFFAKPVVQFIEGKRKNADEELPGTFAEHLIN